MDERTCSVEGCEKRAIARGMCATDWDRWRQDLKKAGLPLPPVEPKSVAECAIDGCGKPAKSRGWCQTHYARWVRHGDPLIVSTRWKQTAEERFWAKVDKNGPVPVHKPELGPCWIWTSGVMNSGYGNFSRGGGGGWTGAHRFAYETTGEAIPEGMDLDHLCHPGDGSCADGTSCPHRLCVNPGHLTPATRLENLKRGNTFVAANLAVTQCPQGHDYTPENTRVRILPNGHESRSCKTCPRIQRQERARKKRAA